MSKTGDLVELDRAALAVLAPNYHAMYTAIEAAVSVDEIAELADQAVAAQAYFCQSRDVNNEMNASRIRLRAERKLGIILRRMAKTGERANRGGDPATNVARRDIGTEPTLADLGIPRDRASRAMQLADVPAEQFNAALEGARVAQPRRILRELRDPATPAPLVPITKTLMLWGEVRDLGVAIEAAALPPLEHWRENLQPFQLEELRRYIPPILEYLTTIMRELQDARD